MTFDFDNRKSLETLKGKVNHLQKLTEIYSDMACRYAVVDKEMKSVIQNAIVKSIQALVRLIEQETP